MNIEFSQLLLAIAVGIGATLVMDVWGIFVKYAFNIAPTNYCLVGRWLCHMPEGAFRHSSIAAAAAKPYECAIGWITHYLIGVMYAILLVLLASARWLQEPTLLPAVSLGLATVAMPFLVMQPAFGLGIASTKTAKPVVARIKSLMNHAVFGFGLYISALVLGTIS